MWTYQDWQAGTKPPKGYDVADCERDGWTAQQVTEYMKATVKVWPFEPDPEPDPAPTDPEPNLPVQPEPSVADPRADAVEFARESNDVDIHSQAPDPSLFPYLSVKGKVLNTIPNLEFLLRWYKFTVSYDVIRKDLRISFPGQEGSVDNQRQVAINTILSLCGVAGMPKEDAINFLVNIGDKQQYNPVMTWVTSKPWDGITRLPEIYATLALKPGIDPDFAYSVLIRKWLLSAMAAASKPSGFRSRGVLVLQGPQSIGKTEWVKMLMPVDMRELVKTGAVIDPNNKDTIISALSHWLVELGELDATFKKSDVALLKSFISLDHDMFRRPYARSEEKYPRRTVFFASVNEGSYLIDDTGNSRWWTVPITAVDYRHSIDVQQLWAEMLHYLRNGDQWWLTPDEEAKLDYHNDYYRRIDPVEDLIASKYDVQSARTRKMTAAEVLIEVGFDRPTNGQAQKASQVLKRLFGDPVRSNGKTWFSMPDIYKPQWEREPF